METVNLLDSFLRSGASNGSRLAGWPNGDSDPDGPEVCGNGIHWKHPSKSMIKSLSVDPVLMIRSVSGINTGSGVRRRGSDEFGRSVGSIGDLG